MFVQLLWQAFRDGIGPFLPRLSGLITSYLSVLVGALPFMVVAAFASAILEVLVSRDRVARLMPRNGVAGVLAAPLVGLVIPMCECGIIPVARRMIQKGVPGAAAITFMLANPILNPLVLYATALAFPTKPYILVLRAVMGYLVAVAIGLFIQLRWGDEAGAAILGAQPEGAAPACDCGHDHGADGHDHDHDHHDHSGGGANWKQKLQAVLDHATSEFLDVARYFLIGGLLATAAGELISRPLLESLGQGRVLSVVVMIAFAYLLCICSEADAFVAATFASTFSSGALLAFLVAGPMTDLKNTLMMRAAFDRRFVRLLNGLIIGLTGSIAILLNFVDVEALFHWVLTLQGR